MNITQIFCDADDFCQTVIPQWKKTLLPEAQTGTPIRMRSICDSETLPWWCVFTCMKAKGLAFIDSTPVTNPLRVT